MAATARNGRWPPPTYLTGSAAPDFAGSASGAGPHRLAQYPMLKVLAPAARVRFQSTPLIR
ncbi:hypothetical protein SAMN05443287_101562 [Micromonospora phaseoli]|uniref:Uncharacterized protein n=1 Tax=Micromonospora phaseoli TaxID=1144548 RepID=A0A1H6SEG4_9ACTN|nr:hypothetical protein CLV64_101562 [Micromonospora phaseoli]GIJ79113.1 hypothetical protein Xph01_35450 [Micromonospora phaseoli]SEI63167.1 hypothetical protein SAMN05443287_101562 [Micromonospora phaseoli]